MRSALALYAYLVLGVFLLVAPWTPVWHDATMRLLPSIGPWIRSGWLRGLVSAVGVLDLFVALQLAAELWNHSGAAGAGDGQD